MPVLEKATLGELQEVLKELKLYKELSSKLGKRGVKKFHVQQEGFHMYKLEYSGAYTKQTAWEESQKVFQAAFGVVPSEKEVVFLCQEHIAGGIRVFQDDEMVDLSLKKALEKMC